MTEQKLLNVLNLWLELDSELSRIEKDKAALDKEWTTIREKQNSILQSVDLKSHIGGEAGIVVFKAADGQTRLGKLMYHRSTKQWNLSLDPVEVLE